MNGSMMQLPLLISSLLVHAERHHGEQEIVSRRVEGDIHRSTFRELAARSRRMANAIAGLGIKSGDRVATLAWNGYRHMELYYAVSGSGAVLHTLNPRLHPDQVVYIADHAEDQALFFDLTFLPLVEAIANRVKTIKTFVAMTDRAHMPAGSKIPNLLCYEELVAASSDSFKLADVRREPGVVALLHVGDDRQPEGRSLQPSLDAAAHLRDRPARRAQLLGQGRDPAGRADVPRQRLGPAVRRLHDGIEAGLPRARARRQIALRAVRERARHALGRRADGVAGPARLRRRQRPQVLDHAAHHHRRLGLPAGDDEDVPGALRRAGAARLGHDRDEPGRHRGGAEGLAGRPRRADALRDPGQAGPRGLRRRHEDRRRRRRRAAMGRQAVGRADGARAVGDRQVLQERRRRPAGQGRRRPRLVSDRRRRRDRCRAASCRSPTARRT